MYKCDECEKEFSKEQAMRTHLISSNAHDYDSENVESYQVETEEKGEESEEVNSQSDSQEDHQQDDSSPSNSDKISFSEILEDPSEQESSEDSDQGSEEDGSEKKDEKESEGRGISESINQAYGTLFTWDLEDGEERSNTKKRLKELADDLQLGENAFRTYEKFIDQEDEIPPEKALMGSALACLMFGFIQRPELFEKVKDKISEFGGDN